MNEDGVRVFPDTKQKYVLARVLENGEKKLLLWGNPNIQWHKEIVQEMSDSGVEVIEALGGGWLLPSTEKNVVYVWGKSDRLGPAPTNLIRDLLGDQVSEEEPE